PGSPSPAASATLPSSGGATPTLQAPSAAASATLQAPSGGGTPTLQAPPTLSAGDAAGTAQVVGGAVLVDVIVSQLQDPVSAEAEFSANMDMIKSSLLLSTIADAEIMAHESGDAMRVEDVVVSQASNDLASAVGDPHLRSVTGKKFDVNMPGSYVLLRAPQDRRLPARLELNATLRPSAGSPCGLYIKSLELGGEWLGGQEVSIVPLQRDAEGQNGAGNSTLHPFSVRVRAHPGAPDAAQGEYEQWADFRKEQPQSVWARPHRARVEAALRRRRQGAGGAGVPVPHPGRRLWVRDHVRGGPGGPPGARLPGGRTAEPRLRTARRLARHGRARPASGT
ncbi:unnamed protein product, partial [Prorocentrum cordatum]